MTRAPLPEHPIRVTAPAKLNLGLRIVGRRDDGYHLLESVFVPIDLADDLVLQLRPGSGVEIDVATGEAGDPDAAHVPRDDRNLAARAARAFLDAAGLAAHVSIALRKRIPSAAGLGGGSSDAGAVLRGLAEAWPGAVDGPALESIALSLGADVPFFLDPRPAFVSGVGERRRPLGDLPALPLVLANPRVSVSTAEVFERRSREAADFAPAGALMQAAEGVRAAGWLDAGAGPAWAGLLVNDLAPAAEAVCPEMRTLLAALEATGALASGQSGSGATVFGVFATSAAAEAACESLSANDSAWFRVAISAAAR